MLAVFALVAVLPATVSAQAGDPNSDPTAAQYQDPAATERDETTTALTTTSAPPPPPTSSGALPFTGFDAGVIAAVALLLGATGLALRRLSAVR